MKIRALIVDDEALARNRLRKLLEEEPEVELVGECANGRDAVSTIRATKPDLVFLDVDMPGMNGFELCAKLRMLPPHKTTPVVFVTSLNDLESRANSTMSGGNDFIAKPFLFLELTVKALVYLMRARMVAR